MKLSLRGINRLLRTPVGVGLAAVAGILAVVGVVVGQSAPPAIPLVQLSAEPLYARGFRAKPTLTLALSVEYPTVGAAYVNGDDRNDDPNYTVAKEYVGYFDPNGCYTYDDTNDHFVRAATATSRACDGTKFSGNFMNWATTSAIDILRYGLTGGDRTTDTTTKTVLQRAVLRSSFYNSDNFPSKQLRNGTAEEKTVAAGALPSTLRADYTGSVFYVANCLNRIYFGTHRTGACGDPESNGNLGIGLPPNTEARTSFPSGFNTSSCANEGGTCTFTGARYVLYGATSNNRYSVKAFQGKVACNNDIFGDPSPGNTKRCYLGTSTITPSNALTTDGFFYSRVQVCDSGDATSRPALCVQQPNGNYKPTGNLQRYSDRLRVAVFGYLKDDTLNRYGGVLRAPMKYVGPKQFDSDFRLLSAVNPKREWDESTGVFVENPEGATDFGVSGAVNYLNRFGRTGVFGEYKTYDPVGELYYEALRYLQGLDPTPQATDSMTTAHKDGFPVYSTWTDPHPVVTGLSTSGTDTYACIKNNIVTIGDVNTHADKSLPGNSVTKTGDSFTDLVRAARPAYNEPDFVQWTKVVGAFESGTSVSYVDGKGQNRTTTNPSTVNDITRNRNLDTSQPSSSGRQCCNDNRYYMAGAAYWANTHDIRANGLANYDSSKARPGMRVNTFMIDVNEYAEQSDPATFKQNQFYLAAKYGGFTDRAQRGNPFLAENGTTLDNTAWARTVAGATPDGLVAKNYFQGNNATELLAALDDIFATVVREAGSIAGAALSSTRLVTDSAIFQGRFDPSDWSGDLVRYRVTRDGSGNVIISTDDDGVTKYASTRLDSFTPLSDRKIFVGKTTPTLAGAATEFKWATLDDDHKLSLRTPPTLTPLDTDTVGQQRLDYLRGDRSQELTSVLRRRGSRLGDIVNSGAVFSGKPALIAGDSSYDTFYANNKNRTGTVFVGANDGMLHAFNADTMDERFAYIPSFLVKNLRDYTLPGYVHRSFADSTPVVKEAKVDGSWKTVLVSGAGGGGQGVFALDVTTPSSFSASNVLWEFTDRDDPSIGNVIGQPQILRLRRSAPTAAVDYRHYAVVAGGVNNYANDGRFSGTGKPAIFILDLGKDKSSAWVEGTNYYKIELPTGDTSKANGIVNFKAVVNASGAVDVLYAGDLQGRLWKLNFAAAGRDKWNAAGLVAFGTAATPLPLFTAKDASGVGQPITVEPEVAYGPSRSYIVTFGTGRFLEINDLATPYQQQSYYAVLDNGRDAIPGRDYLKAATTTASGIDASPFTWGMPSSAGATGVRAGWYFNFPGASTGERQISGIELIGGYAIFGTVEPAANGCADGSGRVYFANLASGAGSYTASTVGIQGEPLIVKLGTDSTTDNTSDGRSNRTTRYQVILQGSAGVKVADWTASGSGISGGGFSENVQVQQRSWRQIFNYEEIHNK